MAASPKLHIISAATLLILLLSAPSAKAQGETDDESEFSYDECAKNGPKHWGGIKKEWATCGKGKSQSPIDLSHRHLNPMPNLGGLCHFYRPAQASLLNRGHDLMVRFNGEAGSLMIDGTEYKLRQLHWHSPAEHAIDGCRCAMEMHMVHVSADSKIAVVGVVYKTGFHADDLIHSLEPYIKNMINTSSQEEKVGVVDPSGMLSENEAYYRYMGSLTTPPCTEGVIWTVMKKVRTVSEDQLNLLREAVHDGAECNARPLQPVNGRCIGLYLPHMSESQDTYIIQGWAEH